MTVNEAKFLSKKIMEAGEVPLLVGHFGVGKTDIARQIAAETGRKLVILILSQMEPGDLIGLPSRQDEKTVFLKPDWWPEDGKTIILLDEINRAHRSIRNAIMQLVIDKRIHNHVLPEGTWIMATMNPPDDEYDQAELITDPAFISRFFILDVTPSPEEWKVWAKENNVIQEICDFIEQFPEFLYTHSSMSLKIELRPSPRSWHKLSNVMKLLTDEEKKKYGYTLAAGILGPEAARAFVEFSGEKTVPTPQKVLIEGLSQALKQNIDEANSLTLRLIDYFSKMDDETVELLKAHLSTVAKNICDLASVLPKDSFYALLRYIVDRSTNGEKYSEFFDALVEKLATFGQIKSILEEM
ncbi:AAA family ATPase [Pseudothermotoga thermarum]|uniref:ATPase associated with various cellular activities AAA_5 n=1 Tax=Pseudothermotoga thermarum DSM 5069 TaxID=688269 RepID=F7YVY8_9THEM|nr:MoxR family ATPase [Pseudothermotoga thermarum]AEH51818.1 ATPase associated with various cellular activities AAA_5 [Pseudothermotoga thermarum DSM 5069]